MKRIVAVLAVLCFAFNVSAQTWEEWFHQKKTQINYLIEQISALKFYESTVKKGYALVDDGLKRIDYLKQSDLLLHQDRFASLLVVNKGVKGCELVQRINSLQAAIRQVFYACRERLTMEGEFSSAERDFFLQVLHTISDESKAMGEEAVLITSDGYYGMRDGERLKRLQSLQRNMDELYVFVRHFSNTVSMTALNRLKEQKDMKKLKALY